jgi:hypothetical protein
MQRRFILKLAAIFSATALLANVAQADETIKVGVTGGPHAQVMEVVKQVAAKNGLSSLPTTSSRMRRWLLAISTRTAISTRRILTRRSRIAATS